MFRLQLQINRRPWLALPILALLLTLAVGCGTVQKITAIAGTNGQWYAVVTDKTPFYRYGPQQGNGPDQELPKDSIMTVIRPSFGYVKVKLQNGDNGYVASEDIRPASPQLVAEKTAPPPTPPPLMANQSSEEQFRMNSNDPRLIAPPEPLPEPFPAESESQTPTPEGHP